ncbi:hypothetical protein JIN77_01070 [Verrucomicrobiaceae bacterium R5-34]|uniref:Uncharacterized protein n=1 Tax=Oceaniferula flava TaxID=2800421 RepID=A0AAE2S9A4_9BACT|nr:hypothetical protein [Oceaniferula flavus]MBK1829304.1 hypothetical protein [Verrucomicrobiaceae bacterium R5-34]MBK1853531.1 hypothetical protein [Oceaniferula flavus]MBM1134836.1 hypothetical protein [Oceaniferula flavus]
MPESKTIQIDEIVTPDAPSSAKAERAKSADPKVHTGQRPPEEPEDPFSGFQKSLGWKTRATLWVTQKFLYLRSRSWGKWVIAPAVLLAVMLAIPLGLLFMAAMLVRAILLSFRPPPRA